MNGSMPPERAADLLEQQMTELGELRNAHARDARFKQWRQATLTTIQRIWPGDTARAERFRRVPFSPPSNRMSARATRGFYEKGCAEALHLLRGFLVELGRSDAAGAPSAPPPDFDPGAAEDDFPVVDLPGEDTPVHPVDDENVTHIPVIDLPRAGVKPVRPVAPRRPSPPEPSRPATPPARPATPPAREGRPASPASRTTPPAAPPSLPRQDDPTIVQPRFSTRPGRPAGADTPKVPLREMLGFSAQPLEGDEDPFGRPGDGDLADADELQEHDDAWRHEPEDMEPEVAELEVEMPDDEVGDEPTDPRAARERRGEPDTRDEMEEFLRSSPVLKANARPVPKRASSEPAPLQSPAAAALAALSGEVEHLGVPEGHRAAVRAMLLDLARALERRDMDWSTLSESLRLALAYPPLARRVIPLLVPYLDLAA